MSNDTLLNQLKSLIKPLQEGQERIEKQLGGVEERTGGVEKQLGGVEERIGGVEEQLGGVEKQLGGVEKRIGGVERKIGNLEQGQARTNTAIEALAAGQRELASKADLQTMEHTLRAELASKADMLDLKAHVVKKIKNNARRIDNLEEEAGIPHPHKN